MAAKFLAVALLAAVPAVARTDLEGCTSYDSVIKPDNMAPYMTRVWYVPDSGELCEFLDCGGGRAPPKTTVPGCPSYEGTETYSPKFINPKTLGQPEATGSAEASETETEDEETASATITEAPTSTGSTTESEDTTTADSEGEDEKTTTTEEKETKAIITTITTRATLSTPGAGSESTPGSGSGSESDADKTDAAATPAASTVSTAGAVMPTAGALLGSWLVAGAAVYAGML
ncbi:siderophore biosynthesis enzyme [Fusarium albosuccineum]|uniref:Siderophore biosynthesis enzyme n=1 Tax=Fusarium albosuccineum TaxID=1237068 RepID=A0A8H4L2E5_9HYPO|nr:siderophore biosynthesis enzyme [Fusarium albosuccineum]